MTQVKTLLKLARENGPRLFLRIVGDQHKARVEKSEEGFTWDALNEDKWSPCEGAVTVHSDGNVEVECPLADEGCLRDMAVDYQRVLRDEGLIRPEKIQRYKWGHFYQTVDPWFMDRYRQRNGGEQHAIEVTDAVPVHVTEYFALWSDGKIFKNTVGLPKWVKREYQGLSKDAAHLINQVMGSDDPKPTCGFKVLTQVEKVVSETEESRGSDRGHYAPQTVNHLKCLMTDGSTKTFKVTSEGYFEGYLYDLEEL